jgi:hypothetical protein
MVGLSVRVFTVGPGGLQWLPPLAIRQSVLHIFDVKHQPFHEQQNTKLQTFCATLVT